MNSFSAIPTSLAAEDIAEQTLDRYRNHINPGLANLLYFGGLGHVESKAEACYIWDETGTRYLDFLGGYGVFTFGHRHPEIIAAVKDQLDRIPLSCKVMLNDRQAELAEKLATIAPGDLEFTFFCNSGAEAVEGALKFARIATGRTKIVATENAYHGKTLGALSASGREKYKEPFRPLLADIVHIPFGNAEAASQAIDSQTSVGEPRRC